ncbi:MAG TPA: hypothetical protein ENK12_08625 [Gammaproteobacteria bacterium]|nr:hypothetical protein [Gammaproteobacteria bacterium]
MRRAPLAALVAGLLTLFPLLLSAAGPPPDTAEGMTNETLDGLIRRLGEAVEGGAGVWRFRIEGRPVTVITDEKADRMRILVPVAEVASLPEGRLQRLMQANFDSALDARYAVAKGFLWSAFIHPLGALSDHEFLSGLGQTVNLAITYGSSYSSGALVFGGGDSQALQRRELIRQLIEKGLAI